MGLFSAVRLYVAFDAGAVSVAAVARSPGRLRMRGFRRIGLEPGALEPSPAGMNLVRGEEIRAGLARALDELGQPGHGATVVLPDGIARLALIEPPAGTAPADYVRFRLASSLPWPASDAAFDHLPVGRRRVVGVAVRRATVARYEQLAGAVGLAVERVHLAPLMALGALLGRGRRDGVHALLGDVALCLVLCRDGELAAIHNRRREPVGSEAGWLLAEARRIARAEGDGQGPVPLMVSGSGSGALRSALGESLSAARGLDGPTEWPEAAEAAWLAGVLG